MSKDNGIYVVEFLDQYRVAHLYAAENIFNSVKEMVRTLSSPEVIVIPRKNQLEALSEASKMSEDIWAEYGIRMIRSFDYMSWDMWLTEAESEETNEEYNDLLQEKLRELFGVQEIAHEAPASLQ